MITDFQSIGYAVRIIQHLHALEGRRDTAVGIAEGTDLGRSELGRILRRLSEFGILDAKRGVRGGYRLDRRAREISLLDVFDAVSGPNWLPECPLGTRTCREGHRCVVHDVWSARRESLRTYFASVTLDEAIRMDPRRGLPTSGAAATLPEWR